MALECGIPRTPVLDQAYACQDYPSATTAQKRPGRSTPHREPRPQPRVQRLERQGSHGGTKTALQTEALSVVLDLGWTPPAEELQPVTLLRSAAVSAGWSSAVLG